jgi:hypothetical protein
MQLTLRAFAPLASLLFKTSLPLFSRSPSCSILFGIGGLRQAALPIIPGANSWGARR